MRWGAPTFRFANECTIDEFATFLQEKNNAGNPLTVYYQMATSSEETIDIPNIQTFNWGTSFKVLTTVQPSQVMVKYHK